MYMKLYVTRHGETEYSLNNIVCGSTDSPLTENGREQARRLADNIRSGDLRISLIYTSPLIRAQETAEIISKTISVPYVIDSRIREQDCGIYEGRAKRDDKEFNAALQNFANRLRGGESAFQLAQRVYQFLDDILVSSAGDVPLIVGHACVCKMIHTYFNEMTNEQYFKYGPGNCTLTEYGI